MSESLPISSLLEERAAQSNEQGCYLHSEDLYSKYSASKNLREMINDDPNRLYTKVIKGYLRSTYFWANLQYQTIAAQRATSCYLPQEYSNTCFKTFRQEHSCLYFLPDQSWWNGGVENPTMTSPVSRILQRNGKKTLDVICQSAQCLVDIVQSKYITMTWMGHLTAFSLLLLLLPSIFLRET